MRCCPSYFAHDDVDADADDVDVDTEWRVLFVCVGSGNLDKQEFRNGMAQQLGGTAEQADKVFNEHEMNLFFE